MKHADRFVQFLAAHEQLEAIELPEWQLQRMIYLSPGKYEPIDSAPSLQAVSRLDSTQGTTYFLHKELVIPEHWGMDEAALEFSAGGEGLLKINGRPYHGLDRNHAFLFLPLDQCGRQLTLDIELYDPIPEPVDPLNHQAVIQPPISGIKSRLVRVNRAVRSLRLTTNVANMAAGLLPEQDMRRIHTEQALMRAVDELYGASPQLLANEQAVREVEQRLQAAVEREMPPEAVPGTMHMVGQSHIDVAWLWPVRETVRKVSRTFSTVCTLMEQNPDFTYSQSQPQLYAFAKQHYPELYKEIKKRVAEGRWELVGGMWIEPDLNMPSGESLVRQILHGQRFYQDEFGQRSTIEWLPDTFGYCASLPQLLKQAGIDYFMTTKLGWNDTNTFPYDLFHWVGIDGTSVVAYQNHGVNEHTHPKDIQEHWASFKQKDVLPEQMLLYGHGDGGGGVTEEMVEYVQRAKLMPGLPSSRFATAADFFSAITRQNPDLPKWHGDLYLELHRGTYTTHAWNKRNNRKAEILYREVEVWSCLPGLGASNHTSASTELDAGWKLILLNQFHDIIPGTSIPEVYTTSSQEYKEIFSTGHKALEHYLEHAAMSIDTSAHKGRPCILFNSLGWEREEIIRIEEQPELSLQNLVIYDELGPLDYDILTVADDASAPRSALVRVSGIPAFGHKTIWLEHVAAASGAEGPSVSHSSTVPELWETSHYIMQFNELGEIISWFDKTEQRELLAPGAKANELQLFRDTPTYWDAWDIDPRYEQQREPSVELLDSQVVLQGATQDILRFHWRLNESEVWQDIILYHHRRRVDFQTRVDWHEAHKLLKVAFPVDIVAGKATYEIPFGSLERPTHRNTSWEQAQFEVCGHRWADLSEGSYGISLLNDCKYGYDIKDDVLRLSLLRAPRWPDAAADQGMHEFTYALYPHSGNWREGHVVQEAAELNHSLQWLLKDSPSVGVIPPVHSWITWHSQQVVLETIKPAEDGDGTILRFYESSGSREQIRLEWPHAGASVSRVSLLEDEEELLDLVDGILTLSFRPYEIKTIKIKHSIEV